MGIEDDRFDYIEDSLARLEAELNEEPGREEMGGDPDVTGVPSRPKKPPSGRSGGVALDLPIDDELEFLADRDVHLLDPPSGEHTGRNPADDALR